MKNRFSLPARRAAALACLLGLLGLTGCALGPLAPPADASAAPNANSEPAAQGDEPQNMAGGFAGYSPSVSGTAWAAQSGRIAARAAAPAGAPANLNWEIFRSPGKALTQYDYIREDGRDTVRAVSKASAGLLRQRFRIEAAQLGLVRFSWKVPQTIAGARVGAGDNDDAPVRVVMAFEGDRSKLSTKTALISELSRLLVNEELPYATLAYVWSNVDAPGTVVHNARTDRIRSIVLESGEQRLNQWLEYERDIRADYIKAFGEPPGALISIALLTDSDSMQGAVRAWYGPLQVVPAP